MYINQMPDELIINIISYLPLEGVLACERVCMRWCALSRTVAVWRRLAVEVSMMKPITDCEHDICWKLFQDEHCQVIINVIFHYIPSYEIIREALKGCIKLKNLQLFMCDIQSDFFNDLKMWPDLTVLIIKNCLLLKNADCMLNFNYNKKLRSLQLTNFGLSNENFHTLLDCQYLDYVDIEKIRFLSIANIVEFVKAKACTLKKFRFFGGPAVSDEIIVLLSRCKLLQDLSIVKCNQLTDQSLRTLTTLENISSLRLCNNNNFTENCLFLAISHVNLCKLESLTFCKIENFSARCAAFILENYYELNLFSVYECPSANKHLRQTPPTHMTMRLCPSGVTFTL